jgi:predicted N-acyltransferase
MSSAVYATRVVENLDELPAAAWDELLDSQNVPSPFMRHAYLLALQHSGSACAQTGWSPQFVLIEGPDGLAAACPAYLKTHSYGEYVFDWAWAEAYQRHGLRYYPKLLCAVPFTPVPGSRLLARSAEARQALAHAIKALAQAQKLSSAHVLFGDADDQRCLLEAGFLPRSGVQFHWHNANGPAQQPFASFDEFLASLQRHKRKNIQQERRRVAEAGVRFEVLAGTEIGEADWDFFYACYAQTYAEHGSHPYLTRRFFSLMSEQLGAHWVMFVAHQGPQRIAASLVALDRAQGAAYGRYWGSVRHVPHLHFEACYYQPLQWCIEQGLQRFEGGAQGEHKMARGLLPQPTASAHWLADPRFASAVDDFLAREREGVERYREALDERSPFKPTGPSSS